MGSSSVPNPGRIHPFPQPALGMPHSLCQSIHLTGLAPPSFGDAPWEDDLGDEGTTPAHRDSWAGLGGHSSFPRAPLTHFLLLQMPQTRVLSLQRRFVSMRRRRKRKEKPWMAKEVRYRPIPGVSQEK